jgi:hypothetical protein
MEDFEAPIDDATESAVDPFGGYEPPQEESYAPQQSYTPPQQPPVQPARDPYDDVPRWVDDVQDIGEYTRNILEEVGNQFRQTLAEEKLRSRVETAEARAMKAHDGTDGLNSYSELVDGYAIPLMRQQPGLRELVLSQADPASAAYLIGFCARYPHLIPQVVARNGNIDASIFQSTNFRPTVRGRNSGGSQGSGRLSKEDYERMTPAEFEEILTAFKNNE